MGRILKFIGVAIGAVIALLIVAAIVFSLVFDANEFRDEISARVKATTGRDMTIEGELDIKFFPVLAVDIGRTELGNAPGFGDEPMLEFERARLSIKVLPLLLHQEARVGTAELDSLSVRLAVNADGVTNWDDLAEHSEEPPEPAETDDGPPPVINIASIAINNANLVYTDAQTGDTYTLSNMALNTGRVFTGMSTPIEGGLEFDIQPASISGAVNIAAVIDLETDAGGIGIEDFEIDGRAEGIADVPVTLKVSAPAMEFMTEAQTATVGNIDISVLDIDIAADVEPFSYAGTPTPSASIDIAAFSPKSLMQTLNIDAPETADPDALGKVSVRAQAKVAEDSIALSGLTLVLDDTTFTGELVVPKDPAGLFRLKLAGDSIDVARYMAPASEEAEAASEGTAPVEVPADIIRPLNAQGEITLGRATLGAILFENLSLTVNAADGRLQMNPSADFFEGGYRGDIRIDATGDTPVLTVDERIEGVNLTPLGRALFESDNLTGSVNGRFQLSGTGADTVAMQRTLNGNMNFELADGAWEGTDIWYEVRKARALFKQEQPPEAPNPPRTEFSTVRMTGVVTDGVMRSDDLYAELPFMQVTGGGTVNFPEASIDYRVRGRVMEKPEFVDATSAEDLDEYTSAVIPIRIEGPLASPSIRPDIGEMAKEAVKEKVEERIMDLLGGDEPAEGEEGEEPAEEKDVEDVVKDRLKDLLRR